MQRLRRTADGYRQNDDGDRTGSAVDRGTGISLYCNRVRCIPLGWKPDCRFCSRFIGAPIRTVRTGRYTAPPCFILLQKYPSQERTMTCSAPVISESSLSQPHTSMNDDLSMHIPCFSSLRIVYHHHSGPYPGQTRTGSHTRPSLTPEIRRSQSLLESYIQAT